MHLALHGCAIRHWRPDDAASLAHHANNRKIWRNMRDAFPHPYTLADAHRFLDGVAKQQPQTYFCIDVEGQAVGGVGYIVQNDVERLSAELGYWLAEPYWGRGLTTEVVMALTRYAIEAHGLNRVYAMPLAWNHASMRVLEKAGYQLEGRLRCQAIKDGQVVDQLIYGYLREGLSSTEPSH